MKRAALILMMLSIALGAIAAANTLPREVRDVLLRAMAGEREAVMRYEAYAQKAQEEGYPGAAALFRAQAQAERTHANRFAEILTANAVAVPEETSVRPNVGSTADNLRAAALAERAEQDGTYREAVEACRLHGAADVAKIFDQTRDTEVEHANLCNTAARDLASLKEAKTFYVCAKCGYTTDVKLPFCPACQHKVAPKAVD